MIPSWDLLDVCATDAEVIAIFADRMLPEYGGYSDDVDHPAGAP